MALQISNDELRSVNMTAEELLIEMAVHLYDIGKFTLGQARRFANLDQISLQKEMKKRKVFIKYTIEDIEEDLRTISLLKKEWKKPKSVVLPK